LSYFHNLLLLCSDDEEPPAYAAAASPAAPDEPAEPDVAPRITRASVKKVSQTQARNLKRTKKAKEANVSLEAHVSSVSSNDVSVSSFPAFLLYIPFLTRSFLQALVKRFIDLGTECAGYLKVAKASEGAILMSSHYFSSMLCAFGYSFDSLSSSFVAALAIANARIASLEAELKASQKAYDAATAAKAVAEKS
jgi:hypothetical protein